MHAPIGRCAHLLLAYCRSPFCLDDGAYHIFCQQCPRGPNRDAARKGEMRERSWERGSSVAAGMKKQKSRGETGASVSWLISPSPPPLPKRSTSGGASDRYVTVSKRAPRAAVCLPLAASAPPSPHVSDSCMRYYSSLQYGHHTRVGGHSALCRASVSATITVNHNSVRCRTAASPDGLYIMPCPISCSLLRAVEVPLLRVHSGTRGVYAYEKDPSAPCITNVAMVHR